MLERLDQAIAAEARRAGALMDLVEGGIFAHPNSRPGRVLARLAQAQQQLAAVSDRISSLQQALQNVLGHDAAPVPELLAASEAVVYRKSVWQFSREVTASTQLWMRLPTRELPWRSLVAKRKAWQCTLSQWPAARNSDRIMLTVAVRVGRFAELVDTLEPMYDDTITDAHWHLLLVALGGAGTSAPTPSLRTLQVAFRSGPLSLDFSFSPFLAPWPITRTSSVGCLPRRLTLPCGVRNQARGLLRQKARISQIAAEARTQAAARFLQAPLPAGYMHTADQQPPSLRWLGCTLADGGTKTSQWAGRARMGLGPLPSALSLSRPCHRFCRQYNKGTLAAVTPAVPWTPRRRVSPRRCAGEAHCG
jgi:hypothetical protein